MHTSRLMAWSAMVVAMIVGGCGFNGNGNSRHAATPPVYFACYTIPTPYKHNNATHHCYTQAHTEHKQRGNEVIKQGVGGKYGHVAVACEYMSTLNTQDQTCGMFIHTALPARHFRNQTFSQQQKHNHIWVVDCQVGIPHPPFLVRR